MKEYIRKIFFCCFSSEEIVEKPPKNYLEESFLPDNFRKR